MFAHSLNTRNSIAIISFSALLGILLGYSWSAQYWNPLAHIATENIAGTKIAAGFWIALFIAFIFGCMRSLMGCSNTIVLVLPSILGTDKSPEKWTTDILSFATGAVVAGAIIGAFFGLSGSAFVDLLASVSSKVSVASITQTTIGVLILGLAIVEYRSISLPSVSLNFYPKQPFVLGVALGGISNLGCPSPIFYGLVAWIVASGNPVHGALILAVHSVGRIFPLVAFVTMLVGGVGYKKFDRWVVDHRDQMKILSASGLAMMGTFLISYWFIFLGQKFPTPQ